MRVWTGILIFIAGWTAAPIYAAISDSARIFPPDFLKNVQRSFQEVESVLGFPVDLEIRSSRFNPSNGLLISIELNPVEVRVRGGQAVIQSGLLRGPDLTSLARLLENDFRDGYFEAGVIEGLRFLRNTALDNLYLRRNPDQSFWRVEASEKWQLFAIGILVLLTGAILYLFSATVLPLRN
jgi:hypothetical protein